MKLNNKELRVGDTVYILMILDSGDRIIIDKEVDVVFDNGFKMTFPDGQILFFETDIKNQFSTYRGDMYVFKTLKEAEIWWSLHCKSTSDDYTETYYKLKNKYPEL